MRSAYKFRDLEMLRGLAAVGVVFYHFSRGFLPPGGGGTITDRLGLRAEPGLILPLINGPFMVAIFFVLSSYALTVKLVGRSDPWAALLAIAKRFPRLLPLTVIGTLLPGLLYAAGLMFNREAAALTGSEWLARTGGVKLGGDWPDPSVGGALADGVALFARGVSQYNSSLWTMRLELVGSMLALVTALLIAGRWRPVRDLAVVGVLGLAGFLFDPLVGVCVLVVLVTKALVLTPVRFSAWPALLLIVGGLAMGSMYEIIDAIENPHPVLESQQGRLMGARYCVGALAVFLGVHLWTRVRRASERWPTRLGEWSFAIYVLHMPVMASAGAAVVVVLGYSTAACWLALAVTLLLTFLLAGGVARLDNWWVGRLNALARSVAAPVTERRAEPVAADAP